jgi:hypothetical protein
MSFGLLKHFKDKKKESSTENQSQHIKHVVIGQDLAAVLKLIELKRLYPADSIKLISSKLLNRQIVQEYAEMGVSTLRSEAAVAEIYKKFFDAKIIPHSHDSLFYKDGKFHEFSGRAKPMELLNGEAFFTAKGYRIEASSLFSQEEWQNLDETLNAHLDLRIFDSIEKTTPGDLVEKNEWLLTFKDFKKISCENLYVSTSPRKFLSYLTAKESLTPELIDLCSSTENQVGISVSWILSKSLYPDERTLFIPQSMTHEWGHFLIEFEERKGQHLCHALFLIHEDEPQSEDLASKIKLMKRVIDRVFPDLEASIQKEYIRFDEEMFVHNIKDSLIEQVAFDYPTLKFTGQAGPLTDRFQNEKFLARTLLS